MEVLVILFIAVMAIASICCNAPLCVRHHRHIGYIVGDVLMSIALILVASWIEAYKLFWLADFLICTAMMGCWFFLMSLIRYIIDSKCYTTKTI